jgi:putative addiction module component (TIGR02574 family)
VTNQAQTVLQGALKLSERERARVAAELLASIDGGPDAGVDAAWAKELERRARRARSGKASGQEWTTVRDELRKSTRRR